MGLTSSLAKSCTGEELHPCQSVSLPPDSEIEVVAFSHKYTVLKVHAAAEKQYQENDHDDADAATRIVSPAAAVRPSWG